MSLYVQAGIPATVETLELFRARRCPCGNRAGAYSDFCAICEQFPACPRELPQYSPAPFKSHRVRGEFVGLIDAAGEVG